MTTDQAKYLWIRAHVALHARNPDTSAWSEADLIGAFHALPAREIMPFELWAARAGLHPANDQETQQEAPPERPLTPAEASAIKNDLETCFGAAVPLYDPATKGALKWP